MYYYIPFQVVFKYATLHIYKFTQSQLVSSRLPFTYIISSRYNLLGTVMSLMLVFSMVQYHSRQLFSGVIFFPLTFLDLIFSLIIRY